MIEVLQNRLFQYEMCVSNSKKTYLEYLIEEIALIIEKVKEKGMFFCLTPHERCIAEEIAMKYSIGV